MCLITRVSIQSLTKEKTMQTEMQDSTLLSAPQNEETGIVSEAILEFTENSEMNEGMCSCVCISDEQCCGCLMQ